MKFIDITQYVKINSRKPYKSVCINLEKITSIVSLEDNSCLVLMPGEYQYAFELNISSDDFFKIINKQSN